MPTRFRLPSATTATVSPALQDTWSHTPGTVIRRAMATAALGTAFADTTYTPDAADHLVAGSSHIAQFVSPPLNGAQSITAQTVSITALCTEANAGNNLFLRWGLFVFSNDGTTLRGTLVAMRTDGTEVATTQTNRTDSATSGSVSAQDGDRLVLEVGFTGTPTASGGVQGHNGTIRFGGSSDLTANDSATADGTPWVELATDTLSFRTGYKDAGARYRLGVLGFKDAATRLNLAAVTTAFKDAATRTRLSAGSFKDAGLRARLSAQGIKDAATRFVLQAGSPDARRAVVTWLEMVVPTPSPDARRAVVTWVEMVAPELLGDWNLRDIAARFRLNVRNYRDAGLRFALTAASAAYRDAGLRARISVQGFKDATTRLRLNVGAFRDAGVRFVLLVPGAVVRDITTRLRLQVRTYRDATGRVRLRVLAFKDANLRVRLRVLAYRDAGGRFVLVVGGIRDATFRFRLSRRGYRDAGTRFNLIPAETTPDFNSPTQGMLLSDGESSALLDGSGVLTALDVNDGLTDATLTGAGTTDAILIKSGELVVEDVNAGTFTAENVNESTTDVEVTGSGETTSPLF